ncbi:transposase [Nonomuraea sp. NPDC052116]|uniref:transposase n=1 Tax=Nonomuraea sp. NPDC052116 TaxID=3155665 RepID=UPI00343A9362
MVRLLDGWSSRRYRIRPGRVRHRLERQAGHLPPRTDQQFLDPHHSTRPGHHRGQILREDLRALPCPARTACTRSSSGRRQITLRRTQAQQQALDAARTQQTSQDWQRKYKIRAGVEGTIRQAIAITGIRRARYRGLRKVHLEHVIAATALNLTRLDAWWNGHPLDRTRISHLARLDHALTA